MKSRSFLAVAVTLGVAIAAPAPVVAQSDLSEASVAAGSLVVAVPFSLVALSGIGLSEVSKAPFNLSRSWKVGKVQPRGPKTDVELHCDDKQVRLDMTIDSRVAQERQLQVGDQLDIDAIGKSGYAVRKGQATVAILAEPGAGMVHSKARS